MALTQCPDCGGKLGTEAAACPHCGRPTVELQQRVALPQQPPSKRRGSTERRVWLVVLGAVFCTVTSAVVISLALGSAAKADAVDDAYRLCSAFEGTGLTSECKVKGWGSTVDVTIDTDSTEARKICVGVVEQMAQYTKSFGGKWTLRIFSPYGERPIASCPLK